MIQELFKIPFTELTVKSYGTMMVLGFMMAAFLMRRLSRRVGIDAVLVTNAALYSLIAGVIGARIFFVLHHLDQFSGSPLKVFAIWGGGLEFLGGVVLAVVFLLFYLRRNHLPIRRYLDVMAVGLMMALVFGRMGCFLNGCCFGRPTELPWGIRFPYGSFSYASQINPDPARQRMEPYIPVPSDEYADFFTEQDQWYPKPLDQLTDQQRHEVQKGRYRPLPVHPTQLYSSVSALAICGLLYVFWRKSLQMRRSGSGPRWSREGCTIGLMFVLYGITRFVLEAIRDDNPLEFAGMTISQVIGIGLVVLGIGVFTLFCCMGPEESAVSADSRA